MLSYFREMGGAHPVWCRSPSLYLHVEGGMSRRHGRRRFLALLLGTPLLVAACGGQPAPAGEAPKPTSAPPTSGAAPTSAAQPTTQAAAPAATQAPAAGAAAKPGAPEVSKPEPKPSAATVPGGAFVIASIGP